MSNFWKNYKDYFYFYLIGMGFLVPLSLVNLFFLNNAMDMMIALASVLLHIATIGTIFKSIFNPDIKE